MVFSFFKKDPKDASQGYKQKASVKSAIESIKKNTPDAEVVELKND